jgi:hypothetical protein
MEYRLNGEKFARRRQTDLIITYALSVSSLIL